MRLGAYPCEVKKGSLAYDAYSAEEVLERHRHRYEFNNKYRDDFAKGGFRISGVYQSGKLVEIVELENHPWFVASQFHPEFKSKPDKPHPLFKAFVGKALEIKPSGSKKEADKKPKELQEKVYEASAIE